MNKRIVGNLIKYLLAVGLLALVLWLNWGFQGRVAGRIAVDEPGAVQANESEDRPTLRGTVLSYDAGESVTIKPAEQQGAVGDVGVVVVPSGGWRFLGDWFSYDIRWPQGLVKPTQIKLPPETEAIRPGMMVSVWEAPRGLGYVWQKHVVEGERVQWHFFALALLICTLSILLTLVRWYFLVRALDLPFSLFNALRLGLVGYYFNTFLPGSVGGDIIKATAIAREQPSRRTAAVATVIIDRAIALWGLVCFVAVLGVVFWMTGAIGHPAAESIVLAALGLVGVSLVLWVILGVLPEYRAERFAGKLGRLPKVGPAAAEFWRAVWMYRCRKRVVALALVLSWIGHVGFVLTFYFSALTLWNPDDPAQKIPTLAQHFLIVPIGLVISAIPLFPGGAGIGELGFGGLYKLLGCSAANGVLGSLVQRVCAWIIGLGGYLVYLRMRPTLSSGPGDRELNGHANGQVPQHSPVLAGEPSPGGSSIRR